MKRIVFALALALLAAPALALVLRAPAEQQAPVRPPERLLQAAAPVALPAPSFRMPAEDSLYHSAARVAWQYVEAQYQPATGLINSVAGYPYATVWDIGSGLAALYSGRELGFLPEAEYHRRMARALATLQRLPLYEDAAYNKNYHVARALPAGRNDRDVSPAGYGWSTNDLGRLLVWLKIVARADSQHAAAATRAAQRIDFDRIVRDGYLWGASRTRSGRPRQYQEGRIGYEQYAAAGFALWDQYAERALRLGENGRPVEVYGTPLLSDTRGDGRLTSEPFLLMGLELGWWSPEWEEQAVQLLAAQQARFQQTGQLTVVSEDAIPVAPHYFYYYAVEEEGDSFGVATVTSRLPRGPRWLSAKAAFAWYALFPGPYTWQTLQAVAPAANPRLGWGSGVYERSGRATGAQNLNTAAVILEAALYHQRRRPLLAGA